MKDLLVRPASALDLPSLGIIGPASYAEAYGGYWSDAIAYVDILQHYSQQYFSDLLSSGGLIWVAEIDGRIVGYMTVVVDRSEPTSHQPLGAELRQIYVLAICRGAGVGSKLFEEAMHDIDRLEIDHVWLKVMKFAGWARASYERLGFEVVGQRSLGVEGLNVDGTMLVMKKAISSRASSVGDRPLSRLCGDGDRPAVSRREAIRPSHEGDAAHQ